MMTPNELHYFIAAIGFSVFFAAGGCLLFNQGWRTANKWYLAILIYAGLTFAVNTPVFDALCRGALSLVRDIFTIGLAPLTMLAVSRHVRMGRARILATQAAVWAGIVGSVLAFYSWVPGLVGYVAYGLMVLAMVLWCAATKGRTTQFAIIVAILALSTYGVRLFLPFLHIEKLVLVGEAITFLPLLLFFQYQRGNLSLKITAES